MAWTAPKTWTAGAVLTAAELNEQLRDNLLETMPAKAMTPGAFFAVEDENYIVERRTQSARVNAVETTASTTYSDLATVGPSVTVTTGTRAFVFISAQLSNDTASAQSVMSWTVSGATNRDPVADATLLDLTAIVADGVPASSPWGMGQVDLLTVLTPGENTFTAKYRAGGSGTARFQNRFIAVFPF
ncbi:hypothetical protein ACMA1D_10635 [Streptomyces sp. 796.1]|uniref:hypothetical protein n=1 Tax=Streptomyces sp. 796.1 TaxID=3163029 RepID=UPI0039C9EB0F